MITLVVVVLDEGFDLAFQIAGQEVVLEQHAVLERLVPAFDLALCLRLEGRTAHMIHAVLAEVFGQFLSDVTRSELVPRQRSGQQCRHMPPRRIIIVGGDLSPEWGRWPRFDILVIVRPDLQYG